MVSLLIVGLFAFGRIRPEENNLIISYEVDLQKQNLHLYWKNEGGQILENIGNLKNWLTLKGENLVFAMNAGMFKPDHSPQGLFIQDQKIVEKLDTASGDGNFYLKPNGVFYTTADNLAVICKTENFSPGTAIKYATQSGPMLVIDGHIHPAFKAGSSNLHIRNGVGILPDGKVLFAMSKDKINLYDFANYFINAGCQNALYLDGFVSRMYLPEKHWLQTDGDFGVIIGVTENRK
ncbi:MAG: phosphodiester glycosidase family protein [Saprospiraceae bacterium]